MCKYTRSNLIKLIEIQGAPEVLKASPDENVDIEKAVKDFM